MDLGTSTFWGLFQWGSSSIEGVKPKWTSGEQWEPKKVCSRPEALVHTRLFCSPESFSNHSGSSVIIFESIKGIHIHNWYINATLWYMGECKWGTVVVLKCIINYTWAPSSICFLEEVEVWLRFIPLTYMYGGQINFPYSGILHILGASIQESFYIYLELLESF